jgi:hypothetical protein
MTPTGNNPHHAATAVRAALRSRGRAFLRAFGASMLPWVRPGAVLVIQNCPASALRTGHIVLFERAGMLLAHRVIAFAPMGRARGPVTQGDAMDQPDLPVGPDELLGRVTHICHGRAILDLTAPGRAPLERLRAATPPMPATLFTMARHAVHTCRRLRRRVLPACDTRP